MNRKLRVLMLSLFAVLFAAASAFAVVAGDLNVVSSTDITPPTTAGYNYRQVVYLDTSYISDVSVDVVSWEVYPDSGDMSWLTWTPGSLDIVIEGRLPAYNENISSYTLHVIAHYASGDVDVQSGDETVTISGDISADVDSSGLSITVDGTASADVFDDIVSVDAASADRGSDKVTKDYSVTVNFLKTTQQVYSFDYNADSERTGDYTIRSGDIFFNTWLVSNDELAGKINLPSWLKYEVLSADYNYTSSDSAYTSGDGTVYISAMRIFYSADTEPADGALGSVRIATTPANYDYPVSKDNEGNNGTDFETKYTNYLDTNSNLIIGWDLSYYAIPGISLDVTEISYDVKYGTSADVGSADLVYHYQAPVSVTFSPDISADVIIAWASTATSTSTDSEAGYITLTVTPVTPLITTYSTDMTVTDSYDNTATVKLYITVSMDAMYISPDTSASVSVDVGKSADVSFTVHNFSGKIASWDLGTIPSGITVTSASSGDYNETVTLTVTASRDLGTYSFDITAVDSDSRSADITVYVEVTPVLGPVFRVMPNTRSVTVEAGGSAVDVSFDVMDYRGTVAWTYSTLPDGVTLTKANTKVGEQGVQYGVHAASTAAAGTYTVTVTASDDVDSADATLTITVTGSASSLSVTASTSSLSVAAGGTANVTFTATGNSGDITWTLGTVPSIMTVAPASSAYATKDNTVMVYTVTGVTAGTGTVTVTARDAAGRSGTSSVSVTVTGSSSEAGNTPAGTWSDSTRQLVGTYQALGALKEDGELPDNSVKYSSLFEGAKTLSRSGTTLISASDTINPVDLVLSFDVDVWRVYVGNEIVAWAYSPGVTPAGADGEENVEAAAGDYSSNGIVIVPSSKNEASVNFEASELPSGTNEIYAAFLYNIDSPDQEIGKTKIATVNVSGSSGSDSGVSSASSGCTAGFGAMVSALAAAFFISKKRS